MKILITGANGQLGREFRELQNEFPDYEFKFTDIDSLDIVNKQAVEECLLQFNPSVLINCAAYTAVDKAETEKNLADQVNVKAPKSLAIACEKFNILLIHISTDYVFDGRSNIPYKETDHPRPAGYYAKTKLDGENEIQLNASRSLIVRTSWLYSSFGENFVKTIIKKAKEIGTLNVVYDQVGSPTYANDLAKAILLILPKVIKINSHEIFHYANEGAISWYDFAKAIVEMSMIYCRIIPVETKDYPTLAPRPVYSVFNKNKIKTTFTLDIPYWRDSLKRCLEKLDSTL